jgi:hypothetical protein
MNIPHPSLFFGRFNSFETHPFDMVRTLERLGARKDVLDQAHLAEAISLIVWDPETGIISETIPNASSILRIEKFPEILFPHYLNRYKGLPPHSQDG